MARTDINHVYSAYMTRDYNHRSDIIKRLIIMTAALAASVVLAVPGTAGAAISRPAIVCGSQTMQVHVAKNTYFNVYNAPPSENATCVRAVPGQSAFTVTSTDQHKAWGDPNISSGWESGEYSCLDAGGACFRYPVREDRDGHPLTSLGVDMHGDGNASYDIWFNQSDAHPVQDDGTEVMIWLRHPGVSRGGRYVSIEGIGFYVTWWRAYNPGDGVSWNYIDYTMVHQSSVLRQFWLNDLFADAIRRGLLKSSWWLTGIDAGFELTAGGTGSVASLQLRGVA
jgi:hypothetical protein